MWHKNIFTMLAIANTKLDKFNFLPDNIKIHNLTKGLPYSSDSVDVVYHSNLLEHFDRDVADTFLLEVTRVLKPGGIHRIVVPDFEKACRDYIQNIAFCDIKPEEAENHDFYIAKLIEQSVRREAFSTSQQNSFRRFFENLILGDARRRGETHQWMYDRINLKSKLIKIGYEKVYVQDYRTSLIPKWSEFGLDVDDKGNQLQPACLFVEALK